MVCPEDILSMESSFAYYHLLAFDWYFVYGQLKTTPYYMPYKESNARGAVLEELSFNVNRIFLIEGGVYSWKYQGIRLVTTVQVKEFRTRRHQSGGHLQKGTVELIIAD
ncbi:hypothetical protein E3N88_00432 [Mikania micrantha]|uniref:Uncharacterized protein n=1 Tax=Mikania micrantha TaxID=192012 RepID=A0A5N6PZT3_9ASTR|nr:hypothetical protein E3N88_00432 [Mikania micrantha]